LPDFIAAATTAGPPVTQSSPMCGSRVSAANVSSVGCATVQTRFSIPRAAWIA